MLCTIGNEDLTRTQAQDDADAAYDEEYRLTHIMSSPIEPDTAPREIELGQEYGLLHDD